MRALVAPSGAALCWVLAVCVLFGVWAAPLAAQDWDKPRGSGGGCIHGERPPHSPVIRASGIGLKKAYYVAPTTEYGHGVLGDAIEAKTFIVQHDRGVCDNVSAGKDRVFEDTAPRLVDLDGDGMSEVIVVASHQNLGARLEVYGYPGVGQDITLLAHTPYIGRRNRWLAPIGAADLDGDGHMEIAYIDRPHLAKTLRVFRYKSGSLSEMITAAGFTNHRIGEVDIAGGIRTCAGQPEMIVATADWSRLVAITFANRTLKGEVIGSKTDRKSFARALTCN